MEFETVHEVERDGFTIKTAIAPEPDDWRDQFDKTCHDFAEIERKLENGTWLWFCVKVTAHKSGVELASDHLGGCMYESAAEFINNGDYWEDMVAEVIRSARETIKALCAEQEQTANAERNGRPA